MVGICLSCIDVGGFWRLFTSVTTLRCWKPIRDVADRLFILKRHSHADSTTNMFKLSIITLPTSVKPICHQHRCDVFEISLTFVPADISKSWVANRYQHCNDSDPTYPWKYFEIHWFHLSFKLCLIRIAVAHWYDSDLVLSVSNCFIF